MAFVILKVYTQSVNLVILNELFRFILLFLKEDKYSFKVLKGISVS